MAAFDLSLARAIGLTTGEISTLRRLSSPARIQQFIAALPPNFEEQGDTCNSVRMALREKTCHCIEAAFIAACALMLHGEPALLMDFQANGDHDHVVALFRRDGLWGAISKSNTIWLRWRDPVYRSPRELAMSYFHEYVNGKKKTLRRVSKPFNVGAFRAEDWITSDTPCWAIAGELDTSPHIELVSTSLARQLKHRDPFEIGAGTLREVPVPAKGRLTT